MYNGKRYVEGLYTELLYAFIPTLFLYFWPFCYPYILHFYCFYYLFKSNFIIDTWSACLS